MIRKATPEDTEWLMDLACERYPKEFDVPSARDWLANAFTLPWMMILRGDHGAGIASVTRAFYEKTYRGHMLFIACRANKSMEGYRIVRSLSEWAFACTAESFVISSATTYDLEPFAKRLGAVPSKPSFYIPRPVEASLEEAA